MSPSPERPNAPTTAERPPVETASQHETTPRRLRIELLDERLAPGRSVIGF
jgi:hypothetical protein